MWQLVTRIVENFHAEIVEDGWMWFVFGLAAQLIFTARFLLQWIVSEKKGKSVVPIFFWYLSLVGASMLLMYFIRRGETVGAIGQTLGWIVYVRNIMLLHKNSGKPKEEPT